MRSCSTSRPPRVLTEASSFFSASSASVVVVTLHMFGDEVVPKAAVALAPPERHAARPRPSSKRRAGSVVMAFSSGSSRLLSSAAPPHRTHRSRVRRSLQTILITAGRNHHPSRPRGWFRSRCIGGRSFCSSSMPRSCPSCRAGRRVTRRYCHRFGLEGQSGSATCTAARMGRVKR